MKPVGRKFVKKNVLKDEPWFDNECKTRRAHVMSQLRTIESNNNDTDDADDSYRKYKLDLKEYNDCKKMKQKEFTASCKKALLDALKYNDSKKFWKLIEKSWKDDSIICITAKEWYEYFRNLFDTNVRNDQLDFGNKVDILLDADMSSDEVITVLKGAKNGKACGIDGIVVEFWKNAPNLVNAIRRVLDTSFNLAIYPDEWKVSVIVPVFKNKGNMSSPDCYRGIALIPSLGKGFSSVICTRLEKWAEMNDFFIKTQSGFRKGRSCIDNIFMLDTLVRKYVNDGRLYTAFIDFRKAFDSVNRNLLWKKMLDAGVSSKMVRMLSTMYQDITACVRSSVYAVTEQFTCGRGLRQGDSLSAVLFLFFVNDLHDFLVNSDCNILNLDDMPLLLMFLADDLSLFDRSVRGLQKKLNMLLQYCNRYELIVNREKSNVIVFRKGGNLTGQERWTYDGQPMDVVDVYTYLGIEVDYLCNWGHAKAVRVRKGTRALFKLYRNIAKFGRLEPSVMLKIFDSNILPIVLYGCEIWGVTSLAIVEKFANDFYRALLKLRPNAPVTLARGELGRTLTCNVVYVRIIKFWLLCITSPPDSARHLAYKTQIYLFRHDVNCWAKGVKHILYSVGYGDVWEAQTVGSVDGFMYAFKHRLIDSDKQEWHLNINTSSMFRTYCSVKDALEYEPYLDMNLAIDCQNLLTRLRGGLLAIRINTARWYENTLVEFRKCQFCNLGQIEDEFHFLFVCPVWSGFRARVLKYEEFRVKDLKGVLSVRDRRMSLDLCDFLKASLRMRLDIESVL